MADILRSWIGNALPDWLIVLIAYLLVTTIVLFYAVGNFIMMVWAERRVVARMQDRLGPNRVGPAGLLQPIADAVKMFTKEDIVPRNADRWVHLLAPIVALAPVAMMLAVIPWGRGWEPIDLNVALLYMVAVSAVSGVGLMMAGWGSNNKFALLGAMRAVAQLVSYEIPAVTALLTVVILAGGMSLLELPYMQAGVPIMGATILCGDPAGCSPLLYSTITSFPGSPNEPVQALDLGLGWWVFTPVGFLGFLVFFIAALAEGERTPFDIPEADSEIVAGYMTEYSGMKFATFYIAQYILNFALSALAATAFLGGWQGPGVAALANMGGPWVHVAAALSAFYLLAKIWILFFVMIWLRGAFPRLRVDQLMDFAWKLLLPLALVNIVSASLMVGLTQWTSAQWGGLISLDGFAPWQRQLIAVLVTAIINIAAAYWILAINQRPKQVEWDEEELIAAS